MRTTLKETPNKAWKRAGITTSGSPTQINLLRTMRNSYGRRLALKRPSLRDVAALEAELDAAERADPVDADRIASLKELLAKANAKRKWVGFIDPIDVRFNAFAEQPTPTSQAVMFCLMDVSGSMGEREKDLAKRFYMLLHLFLKRRYKKVDVVFIRHTHDAQEVTEHEFFYSRQSGGTIVSTALDKMLEIQRERYATADWNIYAAQASDGYTQSGDARHCVDMLNQLIMPLCQYYAYIEIPRRARDGSLRIRGFRRRAVARLPHRGRGMEQLRDQAHRQAGGHFSGVPRAVQEDGGGVMRCSYFPPPFTGRGTPKGWRGEPPRTAGAYTSPLRRVASLAAPPPQAGEERNAHDPAFCGLRMGFRHHRSHLQGDRGDRAQGYGARRLSQPDRDHLVEQMLDAYSSIAMPLMYNHWSFGKTFAREEVMYRAGYSALAYEVVINSSPCISYLLEENTMTMQALVMAHAAFGHNHFFKNNYLFPAMDQCRRHHGLSCLRQALHRRLRGALRPRRSRSDAGLRPCPDGPGRVPLSPPAQAVQERVLEKRRRRAEYEEESYNELWRTLPAGIEPPSLAPTPDPEDEFGGETKLPEENLLYFLEKNSPVLKAWQRETLRIVRNLAQYSIPAPAQSDERGLRHLRALTPS